MDSSEIEQEIQDDPQAAKEKYGAMADGVANAAASAKAAAESDRQTQINRATDAADGVAMASCATAPGPWALLCAGGVAAFRALGVTHFIVEGLADLFGMPHPTPPSLVQALPPEGAGPALTPDEWRRLIKASFDLQQMETDVVDRLAKSYDDSVFAMVGQHPDPEASRAMLRDLLQKSGYHWAFVANTPPMGEQAAAFMPQLVAQDGSPLSAADQLALSLGTDIGKSWHSTCVPADPITFNRALERIRGICADAANSSQLMLSCEPGNDLWQRVLLASMRGSLCNITGGTVDWSLTDMPARSSVLQEMRDLTSAMPKAAVGAANLLLQKVADLQARVLVGQDHIVQQTNRSGAAAGSEYIAALRAKDPEKYQAMADAQASGQDPIEASRAIDASRSPVIGNTGSEPVMPSGAGGIGVAVLVLGGLGVLMLLAKKGGK